MKIIIDVMSGDKAPSEIIKGAVLAYREFGVEITMTGHRETIERIAAEAGLDISPLSIVNTDVVINMEDPALSVVRDKNTSSMAIGLQMLSRGEGDAFVSAGNTGALLAGATLIVRRIKGIHRAAIGTVMPFSTPVLLLDSGANLEIDEKTLEQFAVMGSVYMEKIYGLDCARVGLLNNGTEPTKGPALYKDAYRLLEASETINFVGNVEGKEVPFDACDVLVCDGFTGNIMLKTVEGLSKFFNEHAQRCVWAKSAYKGQWRFRCAVRLPHLKNSLIQRNMAARRCSVFQSRLSRRTVLRMRARF